jgi:hypothetical protein
MFRGNLFLAFLLVAKCTPAWRIKSRLDGSHFTGRYNPDDVCSVCYGNSFTHGRVGNKRRDDEKTVLKELVPMLMRAEGYLCKAFDYFMPSKGSCLSISGKIGAG